MRYLKCLLIFLCLVAVTQAADGPQNRYWQQLGATLRAYAPWLFGGAVIGAGAGVGASHFTGTPWGPSLVIGTSAGLALGGLSKDVYPRMWREIFGQRIPVNAQPLVQARRVIAEERKKYLARIATELQAAQDANNESRIAELNAERKRVSRMDALAWRNTQRLNVGDN